jgi:EAL domain-containing protein (putative c-di-GMP-specific phosphodiesterase class I)
MSIIRHCDADRRKKQLIELLCRFGEANASTVVAEGIETEAEGEAATSAGARLMQGYFYGKPKPLGS